VGCTAAFMVMLLAALVLLALYWSRILAAPLPWKAMLALGLLVVLTWPTLIFGRLLCEIARECTSALCPKCGGPARFDADPEGGLSDRNVTYTCRRCGFQEHLKSYYSDELPKNDGSGAGCDGLGGGGG
jgi:hypothetical protein